MNNFFRDNKSLMLARLYHTIRPLKGRQWWYRVIQPIAKKFFRVTRLPSESLKAALAQPAFSAIPLSVPQTFSPATSTFGFLNISQDFPTGIDWNYHQHGLLWAFNLHYFEWLYDDNLSVEDRLQTMRDYATHATHLSIARHPYPASLRVIAWIRFVLRFDIKDEVLLGVIYNDADRIYRFPEYALDGNHLWENSIMLVCAGLFFQEEDFFKSGSNLLRTCMKEQLFEGGSHKEGSPMYHSLLLWRSLQCIEILRTMKICAQSFIADAEHAVRKMLGWLKEVTFSDGSWPMVNDCTQGIAPTTNALLDYAAALDIVPIDTEVQDSGYFFFRGTGWELFIDAANIAPGFQPGHAHADTGTFCLHLYGYPLIVDTGISTYEVSKRRAWERGTVAHNVMSVEGQNSSDVWKSFRVGKRAQVIDITRGNDHLSFAHDGYKKLGIIVRRRFEWSEQHITITDVADGANAGKIPLITALHFHPDVQVTQVSATSFQTDSAIILVEGTSKAWCEPYNYCAGFNQLVPAQRICANPANGQCSLTILLKS